jgi:hypothetical protein
VSSSGYRERGQALSFCYQKCLGGLSSDLDKTVMFRDEQDGLKTCRSSG